MRRRWLAAAVAVLTAVVLVLGWNLVQAERRTDAAQPVPTDAGQQQAVTRDGGAQSGGGDRTTSGESGEAPQDDLQGAGGTDGAQGLAGGNALTPSNALGAPIQAPESQDPGDGSPIAPWWERVTPVTGTLLPIKRFASGQVRIDDVPTGSLTITFRDLEVATIGTPPRTIRIALSRQPVLGTKRGSWADDGKPYVVGDIPASDAEKAIVVIDPSGVPDEVRSLILFDAATGELLGGAALIPTD